MGRRRIQGSATDTAHTPTTAPVTAIAHNPRNPRSDYEDVHELAESLQEYGVLQPLGVIRYEVYLGRYPEFESKIGSAHWVVLQGNRRLAAAREAELTEVPVVVHERIGRADVFDESSLVENVHRKDLPPLQEAALLRELLDKYGSQRKLATKLKKSQGYVSQRLSLFDLVPDLQEEVARGELGFAGARELAGLAQKHQVEAYKAGPPYRGPTAGASSEPVIEPTDDGVITDSTPEPRDAPMSTKPQGADQWQPSAETADYGVISSAEAGTQRTRTMTFPSPATLASQLRQEYTQEQREELAHLLME